MAHDVGPGNLQHLGNLSVVFLAEGQVITVKVPLHIADEVFLGIVDRHISALMQHVVHRSDDEIVAIGRHAGEIVLFHTAENANPASILPLQGFNLLTIAIGVLAGHGVGLVEEGVAMAGEPQRGTTCLQGSFHRFPQRARTVAVGAMSVEV